MTAEQVRPNSIKLTDADARRFLAPGIMRACYKVGQNGLANGPSRVALEIGCDEKTVRRARDEDSTLGLACTFNLLDVDDRALDELAASKGFALVPLAVAASVDAIVAQSASIHRIAEARAPDSPGGSLETDRELVGMEGEVDTAIKALRSTKSRILAAKLRLSAA